MPDLNPSPGMWEWATEGRDLAPDDAIVLRYAGELYRRARAVQEARRAWEACFSESEDFFGEEKWSDRQKRLNDVVVEKQDHLEALLDELRKELTDD